MNYACNYCEKEANTDPVETLRAHPITDHIKVYDVIVICPYCKKKNEKFDCKNHQKKDEEETLSSEN